MTTTKTKRSIVQIEPIQTKVFHRGQNLTEFIVSAVPKDKIKEEMVLAITSKIVSISEDRFVSRKGADKASLVKKEADVFLGEVGYGVFLTIKEGLFIPSAGIDESNSESGDFILFPKDPFLSAKTIWQDLRIQWGVDKLGIILTDSHTSPLRKGVTGICLSYWGFRPVKDMIGTKDLFGRPLMMTKMNLADGLASMAVMLMGEGRECQPLAVIHGADLEFCDEVDPLELQMPAEEDLYYPIFKNWMKQGL